MKKAVLAVLLAAALLVSAGCSLVGGGADGAMDEEAVVASLDEYTVSLLEYNYFYRSYQRNWEQQAMYTYENLDGFWDEEEDGVPMRQLLQEQALSAAKEYAVLYTRAKQAGTEAGAGAEEASDAQVDAMAADVEAEGLDFYEQYLMTPEQMKEMYHRFDLIDKFQEELYNGQEISEADIRAAYEADQDQYDQVIVRHVLILCNDDMSEEEQAEAKEKAEDILAQLEDGADIGALAGEYSEDPGSVDQEGEYTFGRGMMVPEFEEWSFAAAAGDQGMVKTDYGYHVMEKMGQLEFEELAGEVENNLREEALWEVYAEAGTLAYEEWEEFPDVIQTISV